MIARGLLATLLLVGVTVFATGAATAAADDDLDAPHALDALVQRFEQAVALVEGGDLDGAIAALGPVRDAFLEALPPTHPYRPAVSRTLATLHRERGDAARAVELEQSALDDLAQQREPDDIELLSLRMDMVERLTDLARWREAIALAEQTLPALRAAPDAPVGELPVRALQAARPAYLIGRWSEAEALQRHALAQLVADGNSRNRPDYAWIQVARLHLAHTLKERGALLEARALAEAAIEGYAREAPLDPPDPALARHVLAGILLCLGDPEAGREQSERACAELAELLPATDSRLLDSLGLLSNLRQETGDEPGALVLMSQVLAALEGQEGERSMAIRAHVDHAALLRETGRPDAARDELQALLAAGDLMPLLAAQIQRELGKTWQRLGDDDVARSLLASARDELQRLLPSTDERVIEAVADNLEATARIDAAARWKHGELLASLLVSRTDELVGVASPREIEAMTGALLPEVSSLLRAALDQPELWPAAVTACEALRGVGLRAASLGAARRDDTTRRLARDCLDAAGELRAAAAELDPERLREARTARDRARRELTQHLAEVTGATLAAPTLSTLAAGLSPDERLLGYWVVSGQDDGPSRLAGYLLAPSGEVALADLGPLEDVRDAVACWRRAVGVPADTRVRCADGSVTRCGHALVEMAIAPFATHLAGARRLAVSADDALHLVPLDALPWGDGLLGDTFAVHRRPGSAPATPPTHAPPELLVLGDLDYGAHGERFAPLPSTRTEIDAVAARFAEAAPEAPVRRLTGGDVDLEALAAATPGATVVHLATHAWDRPAAEVAGGRGRLEERLRGLSPLLLTGLALGGGEPSQGAPSAEELSALDLSRCELAVLSGCATDVGEPRTWQGLASLRKALHLAGARRVVASLWPVDDHWTSVLMDAFHRGLWERGLSPERALWEARMAVREQAPLPRHWAGWVLGEVGRHGEAAARSPESRNDATHVPASAGNGKGEEER